MTKERDNHLGKVLYEKMEHLDPGTEDVPWESLTVFDRDFYITCAEAVDVAARAAPEPAGDGGIPCPTCKRPFCEHALEAGTADYFFRIMCPTVREPYEHSAP